MRIGSYDVAVVRDGVFLLDGGAMFGVVPRPLWERSHPPDEQNRVELALNCLLLRSEERTIVVDVGMGEGYSEKERAIYGLSRPQGGLLEDLARHDVAVEDVTDVILTHLHFDHAGGLVRFDEDGRTSLTFPRARHWVQRQHLRWGEDPSERDRRSFQAHRWQLLREQHADQLQILDGPGEFLPQIEALIVSGHTSGQQLILVGPADGQRLLFCADLVPYASQVRLPWIMAFDLHPLLTLEEKKEILARACNEDWILVFQHDVDTVAARLREKDGRVELGEEVAL